MSDFQPYLSLVVTARNDDHGGNLLGRMQIFVNGWLAQSQRHNLPSELIIVEWNPPAGRPSLREVLSWPLESDICRVRFIEVPPEIHARYAHAEALPLYQMIAKNVGIRRARGEFILATNIDILFSDELVAHLAGRGLDPSRMYRVDRHDAMGDVPADATLDRQLDYCRTHLLRVNSRDGTCAITQQSSSSSASQSVLAKAPFHFWKKLQGVIHRMASDSPVFTITLPCPSWLKRAAVFYLKWGGFTGMVRNLLTGQGWVRSKLDSIPSDSSPSELLIPSDSSQSEFLHTNGCGDFTLLARQYWFDLRGYPEFDLFSMNIDSVFCYCAHYAGAREQILPDPMRIYHIEHATGSGWTPEGQDQLFRRIAAKGLGFVSYGDVIGWAQQMRRLNCTLIFNREDWGLANFELKESQPSREAAVATSSSSVQRP